MSETRFEEMIRDAVERQFGEIVEQEIERFIGQVRARARERLAGLTAAIFSEYSMERRGQNLVITVKISEPSGNGNERE